MESTLILSPPTSRARAARSSVVVITLSLPAACEMPLAAVSARTASVCRRLENVTKKPLCLRTARRSGWVTSGFVIGLERVCTVRPHGEHELEEELVCPEAFAVADAAGFAADLAEFAGPIRDDEGAAIVLEQRIDQARRALAGGVGIGGQAANALRAIEAETGEPAAVPLVFAGGVHAERGADDVLSDVVPQDW